MTADPLTPKVLPNNAARPSIILTEARLGNRRSRWSLGRKMLAGYGVAIAIAIAGTAIGFFLSKQIEHQAQAVYLEAFEDERQVSRLQKSLLELVIHKEPILPKTSGETANTEFQEELVHWVEDYREFKQIWQALQESDEFQGAEATEETTEMEAEIAASILQDYEPAVNNYIQQVDRMLVQIDPSNLKPEQIPQLQATLAKLNESPLIVELDNLIEQVEALAKATEEEYREARALSQQAFFEAAKLLMASVVVSGAIGLVAIYMMSRILLRPLQGMTKIAQQSIQEANFDLQVPVTSRDEAGVLAQTFNAYMQFVSQLLAQHQTTNVQLQTTLEELKRTQGQMVQSEKMSSLGQMVAGVAHEINNPVSFIHGNLDHVQDYTQDLLELVALYQRYYPDPAAEIQTEAEEIDLEFIQVDLPKTLASMQVGTDRIREIVLSLRTFSRTDEAELKTVDLHEGLENTLMILNHRLKASSKRSEIKVIKDYAALPKIECYPGLLNQAFMNILANAIDAVEEVATQENPGQITLRTALLEDECVRIAIADNGPGISPEVQQRIFDPFFTTKPIGKGTGIGMSISYQVVTERHGGKLACFSVVGEGTKFEIELPIRQVAIDIS